MKKSKLTDKTQSSNRCRGSQLTRKQSNKFKIGICGSLENDYCFKKLKQNNIKSFHGFIESTVGKNLTITQVDNLYLRTKGKVTEKMSIHGSERSIIHYGQNRKSFRIFGYYNSDAYFIITRIDPNHKTHKS